MRVVVTGAKGQLGSDLLLEFQKRGVGTVGIDMEELDIRDAANCKLVLKRLNKIEKVDAVIHCAAYTAVDRAEDEIDIVREINVNGTENIAAAAKEIDAKLMYISTDYVFDGEGDIPWKPDDDRNPLNVYGQMKYEGELAIEDILEKYFIVRISWVFGLKGQNFIKTMLKLGKEREELNVVDDQIGSPTYTKDLSRLLVDMALSEKYGKYHASNEGYCSWYEFAKEIFKQVGYSVKVNPVDSSAFPVKAKRPHNSRMDKCKLDENWFERLPDWQDALARYLVELRENGELN